MAKRRRKFPGLPASTGSPAFEERVVLELLSGVKTRVEACREYGYGSQTLSKWKAHFL